MKKLTAEEMAALETMLERGIINEQIAVEAVGKTNACHDTYYGTTELGGCCNHGEVLTIQLMPKGLKYLWVRYCGSMGGKKKATNAKKLRKL